MCVCPTEGLCFLPSPEIHKPRFRWLHNERSVYRASDGGIRDECRHEKDSEENGRGLIEIVSFQFHGGTEENHGKPQERRCP
jgi:hypothetical protein